MAVGLAHLLGHLRPLRHAPAQADHLLGVGLLRVGQRAQIAVDPLLRVVADGAGVQHYHVRLSGVVGEGAAHGLQHAHDVLTVGHVLLAAEGVHHGAQRPLGVHIPHFRLKVPLARQLLRGDLYLCSVQRNLPAPEGRTVRIVTIDCSISAGRIQGAGEGRRPRRNYLRFAFRRFCATMDRQPI